MCNETYGMLYAKKIHFSLYLIIIPISLFLLSSCAQGKTVTKESHATAQSQLQFDESVYDFGIVGPGEKITHTFSFTNTGTTSVKITRVSTSCGCTAALVSKSDISPGERGKIRASLETKDYESKLEETINVYLDAPDMPAIELTLRGLVKTEVAVNPEGIYFGSIQKGETATARVRLLQLSQEPLFLKKIEANKKYVSVKTSRFREENSRGINIDVTLKPEIPTGKFNEVITLHVNVKKNPRIDVPIWANVLGQ